MRFSFCCITNYFLTEGGRYGKILNLGVAISTPLSLGPRLRFSSKDRPFEVNKLFILQHFALFSQARPAIGPWALREYNDLKYANHSVCYIGASQSRIMN